MKVLKNTVTFIPITKFTKLQSAVAKLFKLPLAQRYTMEARIKLEPNKTITFGQNVIDNCGNEWSVLTKKPDTNEYLLVSGTTIHECDSFYFLTDLELID